jgi:Na+/H+ antiporter NhaB
MDAISTFLKENYDLITLIVGVIGVIIAFITLYHEVSKKKNKKK